MSDFHNRYCSVVSASLCMPVSPTLVLGSKVEGANHYAKNAAAITFVL